jgi:hypothetical protein
LVALRGTEIIGDCDMAVDSWSAAEYTKRKLVKGELKARRVVAGEPRACGFVGRNREEVAGERSGGCR